MKHLTYLLLALLAVLILPVSVLAEETDVAAMIEALPSVEEFKAMDSEAQVDAYNRTQAAYDAYMALPTAEEKAAIEGAEETFEALFAHYNTLIAPVESGKVGWNFPAWILILGLLALLAGLGLRKKKA